LGLVPILFSFSFFSSYFLYSLHTLLFAFHTLWSALTIDSFFLPLTAASFFSLFHFFLAATSTLFFLLFSFFFFFPSEKRARRDLLFTVAEVWSGQDGGI
jgi:hypothetical protein